MVSQLDCKQSILRRVTSLPGGLTPFQCTYCTGYTPALMPAPAAESCFHLTWLRKPPGQRALAAEEWSMCARAVHLSHSRRHPAFSNPFRRTPGQPSVPPIYPAASGPESAAVVLIVADVQAPNVCCQKRHRVKWTPSTPKRKSGQRQGSQERSCNAAPIILEAGCAGKFTRRLRPLLMGCSPPLHFPPVRCGSSAGRPAG